MPVLGSVNYYYVTDIEECMYVLWPSFSCRLILSGLTILRSVIAIEAEKFEQLLSNWFSLQLAEGISS